MKKKHLFLLLSILAGFVSFSAFNPMKTCEVGCLSNDAAPNAVNVISSSDSRFKEDIHPILAPLDKVLNLQGVTFNWKVDEFPKKNFSTGRQIGFVAQDVQSIIPEVVTTDQDQYLGIDYGKLTPLLVEAIKEQQNQFIVMQSRFELMKTENSELKQLLERLQNEVSALKKEVEGIKRTTE